MEVWVAVRQFFTESVLIYFSHGCPFIMLKSLLFVCLWFFLTLSSTALLRIFPFSLHIYPLLFVLVWQFFSKSSIKCLF